LAASTDCKTKYFFQAGFRQLEIDAVITVLGGISGLDLQSQQQQGSGLYAGVAPSKPKAFEKLLLAAADSGKDCCDAVIHQHSMGQMRCNICRCCRVYENARIVVHQLLILVRHGFGLMKSFVRAMKNDLLAKTRMQSLNLMRRNDESSCVGSSTRSLKDDRV